MTCMNWFNMMWGNTCNLCRDANKKHKELVSVARASGKTTEYISQLQSSLETERKRRIEAEDVLSFFKEQFEIVIDEKHYKHLTAWQKARAHFEKYKEIE